MKITRLIFTSLVLIVSTAVMAAPMDDGPGASGGCEGLRFATGPTIKGIPKGYASLYRDIVKVCGKEVNLCEVSSDGGLDNLNKLSVKEADVGLAQLDTLMTMRTGDENVASLLGVAGLNTNFLHVLVNANGYVVQGEKKLGFFKGDNKVLMMSSVSNIKGYPVAMVGSAMLLGSQLNKILSMNLQPIAANSDHEAIKMLKANQVAAVMTVSGWPSGVVKSLGMDSGVTLAAFDLPAPPGYVVKPVNYKNIGVYNTNLLGSQNLLLTRAFKSDNVAEVSKLKACIARNLDKLKDGAFEPAWNEIKSLDNMGDVTKFVGNGKK